MSPSTAGVCMVTGSYAPEISGGGLQCRTLVAALGGDPACFILTTTTQAGLPARDRGDFGEEIWRIFVHPESAWSKLKASLRLIQKFWANQERFQIVQLHGISQKNWLLILLAKLLGKKVVWKMTSSGQDDPATLHRERVPAAAWLLRRADAIVSISPSLTRSYQKSELPSQKLLEVPNGVNGNRFRPPQNAEEKLAQKQALGLRPDIPWIICVGFFSADKAPDTAAAAWAQARTRWGRPIGLVFIGSRFGSYHEIDPKVVRQVDRQVAPWGKEVHFVEQTSVINQWFQGADIFLSTSRREGLPNALLEAMASGLPCVAARLEGVTDAIISDGKNGILVPPDDIDGFAEEILRLLADEELRRRMGESARRTALERFSIEEVAARYRALYARLQGES